MSDVDAPSRTHHRRQCEEELEDALHLGPRKKPYATSSFVSHFIDIILHRYFDSCVSDPLTSYGRHFGRTEHAFCSIKALLQNGSICRMVLANEHVKSRTPRCVSCYMQADGDMTLLDQTGKGVSRLSYPSFHDSWP